MFLIRVDKALNGKNAKELKVPIVFDDAVIDGCGSSERQVDEIQLHIIAWQRPKPIIALLDQLKESNYNGWNAPVPLYIHLDGGALNEVITLVNEFEWTHGAIYLKYRKENVGLREM